MTEPDVASSDATNIATRIERDGDEFVINGRKWWITGAADPRCRVAPRDGRTDPDAACTGSTRSCWSRWMRPVCRSSATCPCSATTTTGALEIALDGCVPADNLLGAAGAGSPSHRRLGPGRVHHCMRPIGMANGRSS